MANYFFAAAPVRLNQTFISLAPRLAPARIASTAARVTEAHFRPRGLLLIIGYSFKYCRCSVHYRRRAGKRRNVRGVDTSGPTGGKVFILLTARKEYM